MKGELKMKKPNVTKLMKDVKTVISKNSPGILTGLGVAGMATTAVLAVKATPKALRLMDEAENEKGDDLTKVEAVKACWKCYIPAVATGAVSAACIIGANSVNARRNAALATAYQLSTTALAEYKEKVVETIGEKKAQTIKEKIAKDKIEKNPVTKSDIIITEKGNTLCYDALSGRYFRSDIDKIRRVVNELNKRMLSEMYISLNEFYSELGLRGTTMGDELGWNIDDGMIELDFGSQLTEDDTPCIVVDYLVAPRYDFSKLI